MSQDAHHTHLPISHDQAAILIVDDVPENLGLLHESLDQAGYRVLVTTDGLSAIEIAHRCLPDMILLDGNMPHMDGFESCLQLKASPITQLIPVIFMTGLSETEHIVKGFQVGGVDYVTKPLNIEEVLARVKTHLAHAKLLQQQKQVIDATEVAIIALDIQGEMAWQTDKATLFLNQYLQDQSGFKLGLKQWFADIKKDKDNKKRMSCTYSTSTQQLQLILLTPWQDNLSTTKNYLVQIKISSTALSIEDILKHCPQLTQREAEVSHWLALGKTNKDIAEILELSPRTVNKHLEHIFEKLCVENRTAAVAYMNSLVQDQS
ncbi:DNA-binding NarL/FixJ family response regulator [Acinetobacter baylyi]|uniref:DNA-binding NarL/FixJ family response regulator n=1 Tax=Acinetobacter baylyi TaxID=202950 RepID=A0ABU0V1F1_ACIBI|nr:response regulator transcription factor [Acinetobacter baylyi]MDQ1210313.1 DNA-binding NarL/FixJ family response regulator [Acinetobacter baylyi]MDR6106091.1 DNA-binding NarL/FixJ family response regulator [Acinetobacter baylyi]MDR6187185.1 DNA-binding NarL/FixJ family response regulator [Acinetobacter baylyi]